jgi:hypothetical protein
MARFPGFRAIVAAASLLLGAGTADTRADALGGLGFPQVAPVWSQPGLGLVVPERPAIASLPAGWLSGDALVVLMPGAFGEPGLRTRLIAAVLEAGAGVLELPQRPAGVDVETVLRVGQRELHAGIVVLITHGAAGEAVFEAASRARLPDRYGYSAVVHLGEAAVRVAFGDAPPAQEWDVRGPLFCELLANVHPIGMRQCGISDCRAAAAR